MAKHCIYCGKQINDRALFCKYCGKRVDEADAPVFDNQPPVAEKPVTDDDFLGFDEIPVVDEPTMVMPALEPEIEVEEVLPKRKKAFSPKPKKEKPPKAKKKSSSGNKKIIIIALSVVAVIALGILGFIIYQNNQVSAIDLSELCPTLESGYNDFGVIDNKEEVGVDKKETQSVLLRIKNEDKRAKAQNVLDTVEYKFDAVDHLSNGDTIKVTATYDKALAEEFKVEVVNTEFEYKVTELEEGDDLIYPIGAFKGHDEDFLLPYSDSTYYTEADFEDYLGYDTDYVQRAVNEIYARHGRNFDVDSWVVDFTNCVWYTPAYTEDTFKESWFNDYEKKNIEALVAYNKKLKSTVTCDGCGKKIKYVEAIEDYGNYYCEDCYYDWGYGW